MRSGGACQKRPAGLSRCVAIELNECSVAHKIKSVERKFDFRSLTIVLMIDLFKAPALAATRVRIEKTRKASDTERVPSAESLGALSELRLATHRGVVRQGILGELAGSNTSPYINDPSRLVAVRRRNRLNRLGGGIEQDWRATFDRGVGCDQGCELTRKDPSVTEQHPGWFLSICGIHSIDRHD